MKTKADILDTENSFPSRFGRGGPALGDGAGDDGLTSLSDKQCTAISCLLEGNTMQATAEACEIDVRTLRRWLQTEEFVEEYNDARRQQLDRVTAHLQSAAADAADTLMRLLKCGDPLIELRAAKTILQMSQRSVNIADLEKRVDDLETENALQAEQIEQLTSRNECLKNAEDELKGLRYGLTAGTLARPDWVSKTAWDRMFHQEELRTRSA